MVPISPIEEEGGSWSVVPSVSRSRKHRREMRPAGGIRPCPPRVRNGPTDGVGITQVRPLLVEAGEFSPKTESKSRVATRVGLDEGIDDLLSRTGPEKIVKRRDAVGLATPVAGAATLAEIAGAAALADPARTDVLAVAWTRFLAVAEVYSSAIDIEGNPSIIHTETAECCSFRRNKQVATVRAFWCRPVGGNDRWDVGVGTVRAFGSEGASG